MDSVRGFTHGNSPTLVHNSGLVYSKPIGSRTICHDRCFVLLNEEFTSSYRLGCGCLITPYKDRDHKPYDYCDKNQENKGTSASMPQPVDSSGYNWYQEGRKNGPKKKS